MEDEKFVGHYIAWRKARIDAIIAFYGADFFKDKSLLEVGAGYGDIGAQFLELGAKVTCTDGRVEYVAEIKKRYPRITAKVQNLEGPWTHKKKFDIILHLGVLYHLHLNSVAQALTDACNACHHLVLETEVFDSSDVEIVEIEEGLGWDQALNKLGSRASPLYIERLLEQNGMTFEPITDDRCNVEFHRYNWKIEHKRRHVDGLRRLWFCKHD